MFSRSHLKFGIMGVLLFTLACGDSALVPPDDSMDDPTQISGTVTMRGVKPPDGDVRISVWRTWPSTTAPALQSDELSIGSTAACQFDNVTNGTFAAITADWFPDDPADPELVLGVYWMFEDSLGSDGSKTLLGTPSEVTISEDTPQVTNIRFVADYGLIN